MAEKDNRDVDTVLKTLNSPPNIDLKELYDGIKPSAVGISSSQKFWGIPYNIHGGTGFFLRDSELNTPNTCHVLTDNHVVANNDHATIKTSSGESLYGKVEARDLKTDLALIRINDVKDPAKQCPGLEIAAGTGALTDPVIGVTKRDEQYFGGRVMGMPERSRATGLQVLPGEDLQRKLLAVKMKGSERGDSGSVLANPQRQAVGMLETEINGIVLATPSPVMKAFVEDYKRSKR